MLPYVVLGSVYRHREGAVGVEKIPNLGFCTSIHSSAQHCSLSSPCSTHNLLHGGGRVGVPCYAHDDLLHGGGRVGVFCLVHDGLCM